jgi:hypothetical protein
MKTVVIFLIVCFMLADAFLMWCLLRANALYEREGESVQEDDDQG